jgi:hypothetical protein
VEGITMRESIIRDIKKAESGHRKIEWVKGYMPVLSAIEKEFIREQPFAGKKIVMSIHLEAKTAYLSKVLKAGGAEEEINEAKIAVKAVGGKIENVVEYTLPDTDISRTIIIIRKIDTTPEKYPRASAKISKSPL